MERKESFKLAMSKFLNQPVERLQDDASLSSLVSESLVLVEMVIGLQEDFGVRLSQEQLQTVSTVGDLWGLFDTSSSA